MKKKSLTINQPILQNFLKNYHNLEKKESLKFISRLAFSKMRSKALSKVFSFTEQYHKMGDLSLAISHEQGMFAYQIARLIGAKRIVEFGTSYGVSTIYLAAALKDNGSGIVIGSEFVNSKIEIAKHNLNLLGLLKWVDLRDGDARNSLANPGGPVDMVLLDGSKDLYLEILKIIEPYLHTGSVVLADNVTTPFIKKTLSKYVEYMQNEENGFISLTLPFKDGLEFSIKI